MLNETLVKAAPAVKENGTLASILQTVRAARFRIEDEGRDFSAWEERIELSDLLGEAIQALLSYQSPGRELTLDEVTRALREHDGIGSNVEAVAVVNTLRADPPTCACLGLVCDSEFFECATCFRELPLCRRTDEGDCDECWERINAELAERLVA